MSSRNRVAIIGRPNVGKSTLFNVLTEGRKAVVKDRPGVTRDIQIEPADWCGVEFDVIDTGGLTEAQDTYSPLIRESVLEIIRSVHALVVVMDAKTGLTPEDHDLFRIAKESGRPFLVVLNKVDSPSQDELAKVDFYELGVEDMTVAAFEQKWGIDTILDWAVSQFPTVSDVRATSQLTLAIIGKPNAGKSSLCNRILGENRMLVSEQAGTTVDAIDSRFERNGKSFTIIDTAGLRRKSKRTDDIEILASFKSFDSIRRADIVLLVIDAFEGPSEQDAKLVEEILENNKTVFIVANKSDLASEKPEFRKTFLEQAEKVFHFFVDIPIAFVSAKTSAGMDALFEKILHVWDKMNMRISTSELNRFFVEVIRLAPAPVFGTHNVRFYYLTQTKQVPPSFIAFANYPDGVDTAYRRFLMKRIKEKWNLQGIAIRIYVMQRGGRSLSRESGANA